MKIKVTKTFYQEGRMYEAGKSYTVKSVTASPRYYEIEKANEPKPIKERRRALPRNAAITNQDK